MKATLPYQLLWLQQLFDEFATLIFYLVRAAHLNLHSSSTFCWAFLMHSSPLLPPPAAPLLPAPGDGLQVPPCG